MIALRIALAFSMLGCGSALAAQDKIADCERFAMATLKSDGSPATKVEIERGDSLYDNVFDKKVGSQYVSGEYMGWVKTISPKETRRERFVCLHEGDGKKVVYFGFVPE